VAAQVELGTRDPLLFLTAGTVVARAALCAASGGAKVDADGPPQPVGDTTNVDMTKTENNAPVVETQMLIRRPIAQVFEAFVDPAVTTRFWFTKSSGKLEANKQLRWEWEMYGASVEVDVKAVEPNQRILIAWGSADAKTSVEWTFERKGDDRTLVAIKNWGFAAGADGIAHAVDSMGGFTLALAALKAFLEHGIDLKVVVDRHPGRLVSSFRSHERA
jgi:uncharacterized protein YndB with AHSA1/START domain